MGMMTDPGLEAVDENVDLRAENARLRAEVEAAHAERDMHWKAQLATLQAERDELRKLLDPLRHAADERDALKAELAQEKLERNAEYCNRVDRGAYGSLMSMKRSLANELQAAREHLSTARSETRREVLEEAAKVAEDGGCSCNFAPCDHDEAGENIAARIRALATSAPVAPEWKEKCPYHGPFEGYCSKCSEALKEYRHGAPTLPERERTDPSAPKVPERERATLEVEPTPGWTLVCIWCGKPGHGGQCEPHYRMTRAAPPKEG